MTDKEKQDYKQVQARLLAKHLIESKNRRKENRQEQIEEIARDVCKNVNTKMCADGTCPKTWECPYSNTMAKILIKKGYRKIPEGSVVLSIEEVNEFRKDSAEVKFLKNKIIEQARKETARDIFNKIKIKVLTEDMTEDRPQTLYRFTSFDIMKMSREIVEEFGVVFGNGHAIVEVEE